MAATPSSGFGGRGRERFLVGDVTSIGRRESTAVLVQVPVEGWGSGKARSVFTDNPVGRLIDAGDVGGVPKEGGLATRLGLGVGEPGALSCSDVGEVCRSSATESLCKRTGDVRLTCVLGSTNVLRRGTLGDSRRRAEDERSKVDEVGVRRGEGARTRASPRVASDGMTLGPPPETAIGDTSGAHERGRLSEGGCGVVRSSSSSREVASSSSKLNGELMRAREGPSREMGLRMGGDPSANAGTGGAADRERGEATAPAIWDSVPTVGCVDDTSAPQDGESGVACVFVGAVDRAVVLSRVSIRRDDGGGGWMETEGVGTRSVTCDALAPAAAATAALDALALILALDVGRAATTGPQLRLPLVESDAYLRWRLALPPPAGRRGLGVALPLATPLMGEGLDESMGGDCAGRCALASESKEPR